MDVHTHKTKNCLSVKKASFKQAIFLAKLMCRDRYGDSDFYNSCQHMSMKYPIAIQL